jgi:hypothetical protein
LLVHPHVLRVEPGTEPCLAEFVVELAFLWIAQHIVSEGDFFEPLFSLFLARINVRMILPGQLAIGFFEVVGRCGAAYAKHMVQVFLCHLF